MPLIVLRSPQPIAHLGALSYVRLTGWANGFPWRGEPIGSVGMSGVRTASDGRLEAHFDRVPQNIEGVQPPLADFEAIFVGWEDMGCR